MIFVISILFWFVGLTITSFTLISIITIFRFAIPFTRELSKKNLLKANHGIARRYLISSLILFFVYLFTVLALYWTTDGGFKGFVGGSIFSLILGVLKTGKNQDNIRDYMQTNSRYFIEKEIT